MSHNIHYVKLDECAGRLKSLSSTSVIIRTRGDKTATMSPHEFMRRFLLHVLPKGFVKIRHYGLVASSKVGRRTTWCWGSLFDADSPVQEGQIAHRR